jgi:hypothetical protein
MLLSGCATPSVWLLGTRRVSTDVVPETAYVTSDNNIVLESKVDHWDGKIWTSQKRYLYRDAQSMQGLIQRNPNNKDETYIMHVTIEDWRMIPSTFNNKDAIPNDLPGKTPSTSLTYALNQTLVPYRIDGKVLHLQFTSATESKRQRAWWSYPVQVLLAPAFVLDLLLVPSYFLFRLMTGSGGINEE